MSGELKHRGPKKKPSYNDLNGGSTPSPGRNDKAIAKVRTEVKSAAGSQWDFKIALVVLTLAGFVTRFWGITHPNSVVFDEVHFGKVIASNSFLETLDLMME